MVKLPRKSYTLEFKQEAVRLVESGQRIAEAARSVGIAEQTLWNWVRAHRAGKLQGAGSRTELTSEQMEIRRLRAELARVEWLHGEHFATIREAKDAVLEWLRWYNRSRMHSTLHYASPVEYEQSWLAKPMEAVA